MTNQKKIAIAVVAVIVIAAVAIFVIRRPVPLSRKEFSTSQWRFCGYHDPKSSILSASAALRDHDGQTLVDSMTPDLRIQLEFRAQTAMQKQNKTLAQLLSGYVHGSLNRNIEIHFVKQQIVDDTWALVVIKVIVEGKANTLSLTMRKINGEWKVDDID